MTPVWRLSPTWHLVEVACHLQEDVADHVAVLQKRPERQPGVHLAQNQVEVGQQEVGQEEPGHELLPEHVMQQEEVVEEEVSLHLLPDHVVQLPDHLDLGDEHLPKVQRKMNDELLPNHVVHDQQQAAHLPEWVTRLVSPHSLVVALGSCRLGGGPAGT